MATGLLGFAARRPGAVPVVMPFRKANGDAVVINKYDPVALAATGFVARATAASAAILGFAEHDDNPQSSLSVAFGRMPAIKVDDGGGNLVPEIRVILALQDTIFTGQYNGSPAATLIGELHDLIAAGATGFRVDTAVLVGICHILGIYPGEEGVANGRVDFNVPATKSQATQIAA